MNALARGRIKSILRFIFRLAGRVRVMQSPAQHGGGQKAGDLVQALIGGKKIFCDWAIWR